MIEKEMRRRRNGHLLMAILVAVALTGCEQKEPPVFSQAEKTKELSQNHQDQIAAELKRTFGTPLQPASREFKKVEDTGEDGEPKEPEYEDLMDPDHLAFGAQLYMRRCAGCHGESGDGQGEAAEYLFPKPRDYRGGTFKFTSTPYGRKPHRNDIIRVLLVGAKGTSMPSFKWLPREEIDALTDYVIYLAKRGGVEKQVSEIVELDYEPEDEIDEAEFKSALRLTRKRWKSAQTSVFQQLSPRPAYDDASIALGKAAFLSKGCSKCHGEDGKGQMEWLSPEFLAAQEAAPEAERVQINYDAWGQVAPAADLTARMLHGGRRPIDVYRRIATGINGTPMPAFGAAFAEEPETIWHLVHYVLSIIEGREVESTDEATASNATPTDTAVLRRSDDLGESS